VNTLWRIGLLALVAMLVGCSSGSYIPPTVSSDLASSTVVSKSYDETWNDLIEYSGSTFFAIENFEKESGLITLSFGASQPSSYASGGYFENAATGFKGDWVDYIAQFGASLSGKMNVVVREVSAGETKVTVNARYIFRGDGVNISFDTGSCGQQNMGINAIGGTDPIRRVCPTHLAENSIISALQ